MKETIRNHGGKVILRFSFLFSFVLVTALMVAACGGSGGGNGSNGATTPDEQFPGAPAEVGGIAVTAGDSSNLITWTAVEGAGSYNLYWDTDTGANVSARASDCTGDKVSGITETAYRHTELTNDMVYSYNVTGVDADGDEGACNGATGSGTPTNAVIAGCTDTHANNYNPSATENDGSCTYNSTPSTPTTTSGGGGSSSGSTPTPGCSPPFCGGI